MVKAVFLDRDGTIIEDVGYLDSCDEIKFLPRVNEAIKLLNENGFKVIIITNQSGVARGYFTEATVKEINSYVQKSLSKQGAYIDRSYYCPHHIEGAIIQYKKECHCRKPNPGMIEEAARELGIDLEDSFVIGDKLIDVEAGRRAGCSTILLAGERYPNKWGETAVISDYTATDLYEAVKWLTEQSR
ncbi:D-glycero-alpha-D-manno-heptose-1,7-bisphosphate 7-phosphatase [Chloroflexota bacterium]